MKECAQHEGMCFMAKFGNPVRFRLFVSGGFTNSTNDSATASMEMLNVSSSKTEWEECASMHEERTDHAMIAFKDELFVFGGYNGKQTVATCEK